MRDSNASPVDDATRRAFLRTASAPVLLSFLGISLSACDSTDANNDDDGGNNGPNTPGTGIAVQGDTITVDLTQSAGQPLAAAGGHLIITQAATLAVNVDGTTIRAFTNVCTHQGCAINGFANNRFVCPCHGSQYDTSGQPVAGPAPQALTEFDVTRSGNTVTIQKS